MTLKQDHKQMSYSVDDDLENAIKKSYDIDRGDLSYDCANPWRMSLFILAREVLGISYYGQRLNQVWRSRTYPDDQENALIEEIMDQWCDYPNKHNCDPLVDNTLSSISELEDEFLKCIWRVRVPAGGNNLEEALERAWDSFTGRCVDYRATNTIKRLKIHLLRFQLFIHAIYKMSDAYFGDPFPVAQVKIAGTLSWFMAQDAKIFRNERMTQSDVSRFLAFLKHNKVIKPARNYIKKKQAAFYQLIG